MKRRREMSTNVSIREASLLLLCLLIVFSFWTILSLDEAILEEPQTLGGGLKLTAHVIEDWLSTETLTSRFIGIAAQGDELASTTGWNKQIDSGNTAGNDAVYDIAVDEFDNVYIAGYGNNLVGFSTQRDMWIKKFNRTGSENLTHWNKSFDASVAGLDAINGIAVDSFNNIYAVGVGASLINATSGNDWWLKKFNNNGTENITNWNKTYDFAGEDDQAYEIVLDRDNNIFIVGIGARKISSTSGSDWAIKKFSFNGTENATWNFSFGTGGTDEARDVVIDGNNSVYVVGTGANLVTSTSGSDWWVKRFYANGSEDTSLWNKTFHSSSRADDFAYGIAIDINSSVYVVGDGANLTSSTSDADWWIKKFYINGSEDTSRWNKSFDMNSTTDSLQAVIALNETIYVAGLATEAINRTSSLDWWIKKFWANGTEDLDGWNKTTDGNSDQDFIYALAFDQKNSSIYAGGFGTGLVTSATGEDWWIKKYNVTTTLPFNCSTITKSTTVTSNLFFTTTCFNITASHVVLDGAGYTITSNGSGYGVMIVGVGNVTIKNLYLVNFTTGVYLERSGNNTVWNNTMFTDAIGGSSGISILNVNDSNLSNNTIGTTVASAHAIYNPSPGSNRNTIALNVINTTGLGADGIQISRARSFNITQNVIRIAGNGSNGIWLLSYSSDNLVLGNSINVSSEVTGVGIYVDVSNFTKVVRNNITSSGEGIRIGTSSSAGDFSEGNSLESNRISTFGSRGYGIRIGDGTSPVLVNNTNITNNNISATSAYEIYDETNSSLTKTFQYNTSWGDIQWVRDGSLSNLTLNISSDAGIGFNLNLIISNNTIALNSSAVAIGRLDTAASITLRGVGLSSINQIKRVVGFVSSSSEIRTNGTGCAEENCTIISYSSGILRFNTSAFSSYAGDLSPCANITESFTLTKNEIANETCMIIAASNVTINGAGYSLTGNGTGIGIESNGRSNITIKNIVIVNFSTGISLGKAYNATVVNSTINLSATLLGVAGIAFNGSVNNSNISNNTIVLEGLGDGIRTDSGSYGAKIAANSFVVRGDAFYAINIPQTNYYFNASGNTLVVTGEGSTGINSYSPLNNYIGNRINVSSTTGDGIAVFGTNATIRANNITSAGRGIRVIGSPSLIVDYTFIEGNNIVTTGIGIRLGDGSSISFFINNTYLINNNITSGGVWEILDETNASFTNHLIYNNSQGDIRWNDNGTGSFRRNLTLNVTTDPGIGLGRNIFLANNTAAINTSAFFPLRINASANITFYGLDLSVVSNISLLNNYTTDADAIKNGGTNCNGTTCLWLSYAGGTLVFNTSSFSSFSAEVSPAPSISCGTITESTTLNLNITATGSCFYIGASNIVLDGAGFAVIGNGTGFGITNGNSSFYEAGTTTPYHNITIKNLHILNFSQSIHFENSRNNTIWNNTLQSVLDVATNLASGTGRGIEVWNTSYTNISNNTIVTNHSAASGIFLRSGSHSNIIMLNGINTSNDAGEGIRITGSNNNNVSSNNLRTALGSETGIDISGNYTSVISNTIVTRGASADGIVVTSSRYSNITSNTITTLASNAEAIRVTTYSNSTVISNNAVNTTGSTAHGIQITTISSSINITGNKISTYGSGSRGIDITSGSGNPANIASIFTWQNEINVTGEQTRGIMVTDALRDINISFNRINTNSTGTFGILVQNMNSSTISRNYVNVSGGGGLSGTGIYVNTLSSFNNISENSVVVSGTSVVGIDLVEANFNNTIMLNYINTSGVNGHGIQLASSGTGMPTRYNNITQNTINVSLGSSSAIFIDVRGNRNSFYSNTLWAEAATSNGVRINDGANNTFINDRINATEGDDIQVGAGSASFTNLTFNKNNIGRVSGSGSGSLELFWYVAMNVSNTSLVANFSVVGANVTAFNVTNLLEQSGSTDGAGIKIYALKERTQNGTDTSYATRHTIETRTSQYKNDSRSINVSLTESTMVNIVLSSDFTVPNVTSLRPSNNSVFNPGNIIEIAANATDSSSISNVFANMSYANGSAIIYELSNSTGHPSKFNMSFEVPDVVGAFNITFLANDSVNNINATGKTNFTVQDVVVPNVTTLRPGNNSIFNVSANIEIAANVTDDVIVSVVLANMSYANGSAIIYELSNSTGHPSKFNMSFEVPDVVGAFNITILVNDTSNNRNATEKTNFTVQDVVVPNVTTLRPSNNSIFNVSTNIEIAANVTDDVIVSVVLANMSYPNGSTILFTLSNGSGYATKFNISFAIPALIGEFNYTLLANDTSNNRNITERSNFTAVDVILPNVTGVLPVAGTSADISTRIVISANITDNVGVSVVRANITQSDGSIIEVVTLSNGSGYPMMFNRSYTVPSSSKSLNITILANDTSNNVNVTEKTHLSVVEPSDGAPSSVPAPEAAPAPAETPSPPPPAPEQPAPPPAAEEQTEEQATPTVTVSEPQSVTAPEVQAPSASPQGGGVYTGPVSVLTETTVTINNPTNKVLAVRMDVVDEPAELINHLAQKRILQDVLESASRRNVDITSEKAQEIANEKWERLTRVEDAQVRPVLTRKLFSFTGSAIAEIIPRLPTKSTTGIVHSDDIIRGNLLVPKVTNDGILVLQPGERVETNVVIEGGLTPVSKTIKLQFSSEGREIQQEEVAVPSSNLGAAVDLDPEHSQFDLYVVIPVRDDSTEKDIYQLEFALLKEDQRLGSSGPEYTEFFGPYPVERAAGFIFAEQFNYDPSVYKGKYTAQTKVYLNGNVAAFHAFSLDLGGAEAEKATLQGLATYAPELVPSSLRSRSSLGYLFSIGFVVMLFAAAALLGMWALTLGKQVATLNTNELVHRMETRYNTLSERKEMPRVNVGVESHRQPQIRTVPTPVRKPVITTPVIKSTHSTPTVIRLSTTTPPSPARKAEESARLLAINRKEMGLEMKKAQEKTLPGWVDEISMIEQKLASLRLGVVQAVRPSSKSLTVPQRKATSLEKGLPRQELPPLGSRRSAPASTMISTPATTTVIRMERPPSVDPRLHAELQTIQEKLSRLQQAPLPRTVPVRRSANAAVRPAAGGGTELRSYGLQQRIAPQITPPRAAPTEPSFKEKEWNNRLAQIQKELEALNTYQPKKPKRPIILR